MDTIKKTSNEVINYFVDWTTETTAVSQTLSTSTFVVPTGLTNESESNTTTGATLVLSSGRHGVTYLIKNTVTTSEGLTLEQFFEVEVDDYED